MTERGGLESALDELRPGLQADGFELLVGESSVGAVEVILRANANSCLDCLVTDDLMVQMLEDAIRRRDPSLVHVKLIKQGFDAVAPHVGDVDRREVPAVSLSEHDGR